MKLNTMISNKTRDIRKSRLSKMSKNVERLYKEGKCRECSVIVTPMDFAKILGKFTKVKIQYESGSPKNKRSAQLSTTPSNNTRLKNNENGMVLIHRNAYNRHPAELLKTPKANEKSQRVNNVKDKKLNENSSPRVNNILKENNRIKKTPVAKKTKQFQKNDLKTNIKQYGIVFLSPESNKIDNNSSNLSLKDLLTTLDESILPSDEWCIDYLPKDGEPKEDKVYDRIAAELEDLMNNEKSGEKLTTKLESADNKDDFPSIMDILNDNTIASTQANNQSTTIVQANLESSDVEAMLLGKTNETSQQLEPQSTPMEVDNSVISNLMDVDDVVQINANQEDSAKLQNDLDIMENPNSPSILDETLQKGVEAHLPKDAVSHAHDIPPVIKNLPTEPKAEADIKNTLQKNNNVVKSTPVTHVAFKKCINGVCIKSVTCPKNLKYTIELEGVNVEFLGAPKFISCLEDLQVLLQIVNETELNSLYVYHS